MMGRFDEQKWDHPTQKPVELRASSRRNSEAISKNLFRRLQRLEQFMMPTIVRRVREVVILHPDGNERYLGLARASSEIGFFSSFPQKAKETLNLGRNESILRFSSPRERAISRRVARYLHPPERRALYGRWIVQDSAEAEALFPRDSFLRISGQNSFKIFDAMSTPI